MSKEDTDRGLSTADLVAATDSRMAQPERRTRTEEVDVDRREQRTTQAAPEEPLAALFVPEVADDFRARWDSVQIGFVDDPQQAVRQADELVAQVMKSLAESFARERAGFEGQLQGREEGASTENMRVALRRYRSFFHRLLSL